MFNMAEIRDEITHLELDLKTALQRFERIRTVTGNNPPDMMPETKNVAGFVPGDRVEVVWDGFIHWRQNSNEGKIGTVTSITPQLVWLYIDGVDYTPGSKPTMKKNYNVLLVMPAEGAEKVCV